MPKDSRRHRRSPLCCACGKGTQCPDAWTTLGHDDFNTRSNRCERKLSRANVSTLKVLWSDTTAEVDSPGVVRDGIIYYTRNDSHVLARSVESGAILWDVVLDAGFLIENSPCLADGKLFVATDAINLWALDPRTGATFWKVIIDPAAQQSQQSIIEASPVVACGLVVIGASGSAEGSVPVSENLFRGSISAFRVADGALAWRFYPGFDAGPDVGIWSTPAIDRERGLLYVGTSNAVGPPPGSLSDSLIALEIRTGKLRWSYQYTYNDIWGFSYHYGVDQDLGASPNLFEGCVRWLNEDGKFVTEKRALVGACSKSGVYVALDRDSGRIAWKQVVGITPTNTGNPSAAVRNGVIYAVSNDDPNELMPPPFIFTVPYEQQFEYFRSQIPLVIKALSVNDGAVLWTTRVTGLAWGSISEANGVLYIGNVAGHVYALDSATGAILFDYKISDTAMVTSPTMVVDGKLFVGYTGDIYFDDGGFLVFSPT